MISDKYKDLYLSNAEESLKKLSDFLLYLEKKPENQNLIENIFRLIHSMKGAAATMGYKKTVKLFHSMENIIDAAYNQDLAINKKIINLLFSTLEVLRDNFSSIDKKNQELKLDKNIREINSILKKKVGKKTKKSRKKQEKHILGTLPGVAEISVSSEKLDQIQNYLDELFINFMDTKTRIQEMGDFKLLEDYVESDKILGDIRRTIEKIRIVPLKKVFSSLPYLVREVSRDEDKDVELIIDDKGLSLDKAILDELVEILIQLLKNAVSHGISKEQKKGKIFLEVSLKNDQMEVIVEDNGRGIDWQEILSMAVKNKIVSRAKSKKMTIEEIKNLIFSPGISKGKVLTTTSGRGIGLSLVKSKVEELGGEIKVESKPKKGTKFVITFPLPLSVFRAVIFDVGKYKLGIALGDIKEMIKLDEVKDFSKSKSFSHNKKRYDLFCLEKKLSLSKIKALTKYVILLKYNKKKLALPIYSNVEEAELIMKKTPQILNNKDYIKGVAIYASSQPVLILEISNFK